MGNPKRPKKAMRRSVQLLCANITQWGLGHTVVSEVTRLNPQLLSFSETHVNKLGFEGMERSLSKLNYQVIDVDHAVDTDEGGTSGGLVLASKKCYEVVPLPAGVSGEFPSNARKWVAGILRVKGIAVLLLCVYLFHGDGLYDRNVAILTQVALVCRLVGLPTVFMGDINLYEAQLEGWLLQNELSMARKDKVATIRGPLGRSIDHVAVQSKAAFLVESVLITKNALGSHMMRC